MKNFNCSVLEMTSGLKCWEKDRCARITNEGTKIRGTNNPKMCTDQDKFEYAQSALGRQSSVSWFGLHFAPSKFKIMLHD